MSRAVGALLRAACPLLLFAIVFSPARAQAQAKTIDAIGLVDYSGKPNFHVGSWVKYRTVGKSLRGMSDDYTTTVLIAGEEVAWGEPCVWVETWVERQEQSSATATLVSYAAFGDTISQDRLGWLVRKTIESYDRKGEPAITLSTREEGEFKLRQTNWDAEPVTLHIDSLGAETVTIPLGTYATTKVRHQRGQGVTIDQGDSSIYYEQKAIEIHYMTREVPITSMAKMDIEDVQRGKSWLIGKFTNDSLKVLERATGATTLVATGRGDLIPRLVPAKFRRPIADRSLVEAAMNQPMEGPTRRLDRGATVR